MKINKALKPKTQKEINEAIWKLNPKEALMSCLNKQYLEGLEMLLESPRYINCIFIPDLNYYKHADKTTIGVSELNIIRLIDVALEYKNNKIMYILEKHYPIETMFFRDIILKNYKENIIMFEHINYEFDDTTLNLSADGTQGNGIMYSDISVTINEEGDISIDHEE